jgi:hypothetical protein
MRATGVGGWCWQDRWQAVRGWTAGGDLEAAEDKEETEKTKTNRKPKKQKRKTKDKRQ